MKSAQIVGCKQGVDKQHGHFIVGEYIITLDLSTLFVGISIFFERMDIDFFLFQIYILTAFAGNRNCFLCGQGSYSFDSFLPVTANFSGWSQNVY